MPCSISRRADPSHSITPANCSCDQLFEIRMALMVRPSVAAGGNCKRFDWCVCLAFFAVEHAHLPSFLSRVHSYRRVQFFTDS